MKFDLKTSVVKTREERLGTIVGWKTGKASELSRDSAFTCAGCKGNGGKRLCEDIGPFTQGSACSEQMVECQAGDVRDAVLVQHAPVGCGVSQVNNNSIYRNGLAIRNLPVENIKIINTNIKETDMVFGALNKLEQSIRDAWNRHHPKAIFVGTSCAAGIIGEDIDSVTNKLQEELKIPIIPMYCEGFRSKHWSTGFDATQHGILRQIVNKHPKKQEDLVNVINLWGSDVFTPMLAELGLRVNYVVDMAKVEELQQLSEAAATVGFCYTLSSYLAAALEEQFGVPEVKAPQPYGIAGTDAWIRELARVTHREEKAEAYIEKEHKRIAPRLEKLRKLLKGKKGYVATGSAYSHGLIEVLRELGVEVDGSLVFHHDPVYDSHDPKEDSLKFLVDNYGEVKKFSVSNRQQYQFCILLKDANPDFILIRHSGLASLASRMGIPAAPLGDEHHAVGYQGILNLGETILEILSHKKFHQDLAAHVKLPYTKWWLSQKDPYVLEKEN
ncbi:nitrogenase component 1 [Clostridium coskatii]|uniref:Nitrogenase molybdenum-iron protein alpha chain n=1 Tax=Clostridium coskatii TaxID=1705578 RepID=A0A166TLM7_9CLOT|nr:nitrogenase component 1 [Clostridium coskatii]OAA93841.1 Nitrogenase molybdenum-iron protein alpha chain [Clostridium coskatii]OBR95169.1 nitrogenase molybdenum-iron protein alpha chain [Clostridium coskatii]